MELPEKTIERLSEYRRVLLGFLAEGKTRVFSHELANRLHLTPVQVRRDIMLIGYSGTLRKGYDVKELADLIASIIDSETMQKVAIVGVGNLGRALIGYLKGKRTKLSVMAAFDVNPEKVNRVISGVYCHPIDKMEEVIKKEKISIGILTVPPEVAVETTEKMVLAGIKGILNYTSVRLNVPENVFLEEYDMITSLEKVTYYVKKMQ